MERVTELFSQLQGGSCMVDGSAVGMSNPLTDFVNHILQLKPGTRACSLEESKTRVNKAISKMEKAFKDVEMGKASAPPPDYIAMYDELKKVQMEMVWLESPIKVELDKFRKTMYKKYFDKYWSEFITKTFKDWIEKTLNKKVKLNNIEDLKMLKTKQISSQQSNTIDRIIALIEKDVKDDMELVDKIYSETLMLAKHPGTEKRLIENAWILADISDFMYDPKKLISLIKKRAEKSSL